MDEAYAMKKKILSFICVGFLIGVVVCYATYEGVTRTGGDKFCIVCHEMAPMVASYHNDVHGGAGKMGIKAQCVDCHMPHNNIFNYIFTKTKNGVLEGYIHFFGDPKNIDWHSNRARRDEFVFDDGCLKCHVNFQNLPEISPKGKQMHEHYTSLLNTDKKIGCASCHVETGHNGLKNMLNYFNPEYKIYEREMNATRDIVLEKLKKDGFL